MSEDMSDIIKKMSDMINNNEIPDNIKDILGNISSSQISGVSSINKNEEDSKEKNASTSNIDISTMLKIKSIIDSMNNSQNDPRANLLNSLKPYLKNSRKERVDQYIKLFNMGKAFEILNPLGGEIKNDL